VGLHRVPFAAHFSPTTDGTPAVEVGWRLSREHWGRGYATEAARAAIAHGFDTAGLDEIVSFTTLANERSWHVMEARDDARPRRRLRPPRTCPPATAFAGTCCTGSCRASSVGADYFFLFARLASIQALTVSPKFAGL